MFSIPRAPEHGLVSNDRGAKTSFKRSHKICLGEDRKYWRVLMVEMKFASGETQDVYRLVPFCGTIVRVFSQLCTNICSWSRYLLVTEITKI